MKYASLQVEEGHGVDQEHGSVELVPPLPSPNPPSRCHERSLFLASMSGFLILVGALSLKANNGAVPDEDINNLIPSSSSLRSPSAEEHATSTYSLSTFGSDLTMTSNEAMVNPCPLGDCDDATSKTSLYHDDDKESLGKGELIASTNHYMEDTNELLSTEPFDTSSSSGHGPCQWNHSTGSPPEATTASSENGVRTNDVDLEESHGQLEIEKGNADAVVARMEDEQDEADP